MTTTINQLTTPEKLAALQSAMKSQNIHAWIIPSSDPHQSEYVADRWNGRAWLSGFDGSAGTLVVLQERAALWTDGRYFLQAEEQLAGSGIELMKQGQPDVPPINRWITDTLDEGQVIGFDGTVVSLRFVRNLKKLFDSKSLLLKTDLDLLNDIWKDRPAMPAEPVALHSDGMAGKSREEKLAEVREAMTEAGADHILMAALDDIAWLFNLRGSDVECNPVFMAYAHITKDSARLFIDDSRLEKEALEALKASSVELCAYSAVADSLSLLNDTTLLIDPATTCQWLFDVIAESVCVVEATSPAKNLKAVKNPVEIKRMNDCHRRDGVAIVRFMRWLEGQISTGTLTEVSLDENLQAFRAMAPEFKGPSFSTIAGYGPNGAVIHYRAEEETCLTIQPKGLLLVDSGGQYPDGTTDITRTFACGDMTEEERKDYTLVLKCHINLARARFLRGTRGIQLDTLARQPAWAEGQNYNHGTGHGVGYFLNVHEGPQSVSQYFLDVALKPGMLITNEPGMYRNGKHGIRIENIMLVEEDIKTEFGDFYKLKDLTLAPIDTRPLLLDRLNSEEVEWLNKYHDRVRRELSPLLEGEDLEWLIKATEAI
ncbi:aminopeptidase P family protein [Endozoicomonas sp. SESOKO3]|uniref:aminopeptidase P family protein n=2 Tax=unclassified Endozoicomonas TaxID=2644528 RepID=UPI0021482C64|nr:aminopeptidase P family protein [Endozoicomonas sp. SESOKO3]